MDDLRYCRRRANVGSTERELILACAQKHGATALYLFGLALKSEQAHDVDLGVKGIPPELFFKFYGELLRKLPRPVDVVDLSKKSLFNDLVEKRGVKIYG